jgi:hypothetical protein
VSQNRYGVPQPAVQSNVCTLEQAQYKLRTELGLSDTYYSHTPEAPIYGTGQGSGNSPMTWCFSRAYCLTVMKRKHTERATQCQIRVIKRNSTWWDTWTIAMAKQICSIKTINQRTMNCCCGLRHDAQVWHNLLHASGGALKISKCLYQLMSWRFLPDGCPRLQAGTSAQKVRLYSGAVASGLHQEIPGLSAYTAHKTLGHYKDPNGAQERQCNELQKKCTTAGEFISRNPLNREEAWTYYFAIYLPSVRLPFTSLSLHKEGTRQDTTPGYGSHHSKMRI